MKKSHEKIITKSRHINPQDSVSVPPPPGTPKNPSGKQGLSSQERFNYKSGRQCCTCQHFKALPTEALRYDYGTCGNEQSPRWYQVLFEHATCEFWEQTEDEERLDICKEIK